MQPDEIWETGWTRFAYCEKYSACRKHCVFSGTTILSARKTAIFRTRILLSSTFRVDIEIRACSQSRVELSRGTSGFAVTTAKDPWFFLNERSLSTRRSSSPGSDLAGKQGCASGLTLRRRYVLLIAASISLLTQSWWRYYNYNYRVKSKSYTTLLNFLRLHVDLLLHAVFFFFMRERGKEKISRIYYLAFLSRYLVIMRASKKIAAELPIGRKLIDPVFAQLQADVRSVLHRAGNHKSCCDRFIVDILDIDKFILSASFR